MSRALVLRAIALIALATVFVLRSDSRGDGSLEADKAPAGSTAKQSIDAEPSASETTVRRALDEPADFNFVNTPLKDIAAFVAKQYKINVLLDTIALEDSKVPPKTPISETISHVPLRSALHFALGAKGIAFVESGDGELLFTSAEIAKRKLTTRVYDLWGFKPAPTDDVWPGSVSLADFDEVIQSNIAPESWSSNNGPGSSMFVDAELVVSQTDEIQSQIARLLAGLQKVRRLDRATLRKGGTPTVLFPMETAAEAHIRQVVESRHDFDITGAPLNGIAKLLTAELKIPIQLDSLALVDAGISDELKLSAQGHQIPVAAGLHRLFDPRDLGFIVEHDVLLITTADVAKSKDVLGIYPVGDLIVPDDSDVNGGADYDSLIEAITCTVAPSSWGNGNGSVTPVSSCDALVFPQTQEVHRQVAKLLEALRAAKKDRVQQSAAVKKSWVVQVYPLKAAVAADEKASQQIVDTVRKLIEPKSWTEPEAYIGLVPGAIVVRQSASVHRRIQSLLNAIEYTTRGGGFQTAPAASAAPGAKNATGTGGGGVF